MYIDIHTHKITEKSDTLVVYNKGLTEEMTNAVYFSSGIHPWFLEQKNLTEYYRFLKNDLIKKNCLALGECGLDKLAKTDFILQKEVFVKQLELNKKFNKPVIIHCVKAYQEIIQIKKNYAYTFILHGFNKKWQVADMLLKNGFYLSFGKALLEKESLQQVFLNTPLNRIFLETDNVNVSIEALYKKASKIKNIPLESVILAIQKNFETVFRCKQIG